MKPLTMAAVIAFVGLSTGVASAQAPSAAVPVQLAAAFPPTR